MTNATRELVEQWRSLALTYRDTARDLTGMGSGYEKQALEARARESELKADQLAACLAAEGEEKEGE